MTESAEGGELMGFSEDEVYLEHFGKKGMKWGVRKKKEGTPITIREQKAVRVAGYTATVFGARAVGMLVASKTGSTPLAALAVGSTLIAGRQLTKSASDRYGNYQMSSITQSNPGAPVPQGVTNGDRREGS